MTRSYHWLLGVYVIIVFILLFSFAFKSCSGESILEDETTQESGESSQGGFSNNPDKEAEISDAELDKVQLQLEIDESYQLTVTVYMDDESSYSGSIIWSSSDESVATVDQNGNVTAVGSGVCYIFAKLDDGTILICVVSVSEPTSDPDTGGDGDDGDGDDNDEEEEYDSVDVFEPTFEHTDKFFYRVGNENEVELGYIFSSIEGFDEYIDEVKISYEAVVQEGDVSVIHTPSEDGDWRKDILEFSGSGLIKLTISVYADDDILDEGISFDSIKPYDESEVPEGDILLNSFDLYLEVEDGDNVVDASGLSGKDEECDVLLADIELDTFKDITYSGESRLFGNGFTLTMNATSQYSGGVLNLQDKARVDHLSLIVADHKDVYNQSDYILFNDAVDCMGDNIIIANCYIQGGRAAVRNRASSLTLRDTTINGGAYANLLISHNSEITLQNVTTNQYVTCEGTGVMGFGVLVEDSGSGSTITVIDDFKQYNWISEDDTQYFNYHFESYTGSLHSVFEDYAQYEDKDQELNTGVLGLDADFTFDTTQITEGIVYHEITIIDGLLESLKGWTVDASETDEKYIFTDFSYDPSEILDYGVVEPTFHWNLASDTNDGGTTFVYNEDTNLVTITIALDDMSGYRWTPAVSATKYGVPLEWSLILDEDEEKLDDEHYNIDVTEGYTFTRSDEGDHYVTAKYTDPYNYRHNGEDDVVSYTLEYTQVLHISVIVEVDTTKHAEFQYTSTDGSTLYDTIVVDVGYDKYVTIDNYNGKYDSDSEVVKYDLEIDGETHTFYAPKEYSVESSTLEKIFGNLYWYYPLLTTISVTDWEEGLSTGNSYTYDRTTTTTSGIFSFGGETPFDVLTPSDNYWSGPYSGSSCSIVKNNNLLCIRSNVRNTKNDYAGDEWVGEFTYLDEAGQLYHYGIDYYRAPYTHS